MRKEEMEKEKEEGEEVHGGEEIFEKRERGNEEKMSSDRTRLGAEG